MRSFHPRLFALSLFLVSVGVTGCRSTCGPCCYEEPACCVPGSGPMTIEMVDDGYGCPPEGCCECCDGPGWFSRLFPWWKHDDCGEPCCTTRCECEPDGYLNPCGYNACQDARAVVEAADDCADAALARLAERCDLCCDFRDGFRRAYRDVALGGDGRVPTVPPRRFWQASCRTEEGHRRAGAWFRGYEMGAQSALHDGQHPYRRLATPGSDCPCSQPGPMERLPASAYGGHHPEGDWHPATDAPPGTFAETTDCPQCEIPANWPYANCQPDGAAGVDQGFTPPVYGPRNILPHGSY